MLLWALLVVLAACVIAWTVWPLEGVMIELVPLVFAGALFVIICAIEARQ